MYPQQELIYRGRMHYLATLKVLDLNLKDLKGIKKDDGAGYSKLKRSLNDTN